MNFLMSYNMKVIIKLQKPFNDDSYIVCGSVLEEGEVEGCFGNMIFL